MITKSIMMTIIIIIIIIIMVTMISIVVGAFRMVPKGLERKQVIGDQRKCQDHLDHNTVKLSLNT